MDRTPPVESVANISIVLPTETIEMITPVLDCLGKLEIATRLEIVIVLPSSEPERIMLPDGCSDARVVRVDSVYPLAEARAAGVRAATAPFVFLGETHSFPRQGMFEAIVQTHGTGWDVVVPIFENENPDGVVSWTGFLNGYASWTHGKSGIELKYAPNFNASYSRAFLIGLGADLARAMATGDDLMGRLRAAGKRVRLEPAARIGHANISSLSHWLRQRVVAGRVIAGTRSKSWSIPRRLLFALGSPLIPLVLLARNRRGIVRTIRRNRLTPAVLPLLFAGTLMQAAGEMLGYTVGTSAKASRQYDEYELRQLSFATGLRP